MSQSTRIRLLTSASTMKAFLPYFDASLGSGDFITLATKNDDGTQNESNFYWNGRLLLTNPDGVYYTAKLMAEALEGFNLDGICGIAEGSVPLMTATQLMLRERDQKVRGLWRRKTEKEGHGVKQLIEGVRKGERLDGMRVAIVEDIFTTGASSRTAIEPLEALGAEVVIVVAIGDRGDGAADRFAAEGVNWGALVNVRDRLPADFTPITRVKLAA